MDKVHVAALESCFDQILHDLDIKSPFLESLMIKRVITPAQQGLIDAIQTREDKTTLLIQTIKKRGPNVFDSFKQELQKDYSWLVVALDRYQEYASGQVPNEELVSVINRDLNPLVYSVDRYDTRCKPRDSLPDNIKKLEEKLKILQDGCLVSLGYPKHTQRPLHELISDKLTFDRQQYERKAQQKKHMANEELGKKVKEQQTELKKLRKRDAQLQTFIDEKAKQRVMNKKKEDTFKNTKKKLDELKREVRELKKENANLKHKLDVKDVCP